MGLAEAWAGRAALRMGFDVARLDGRNQLLGAPAMTGFSALRGIMPPGAAIGLIFAEKTPSMPRAVPAPITPQVAMPSFLLAPRRSRILTPHLGRHAPALPQAQRGE